MIIMILLDLLERCPPTQPYPVLPPLSLVTRINLNHNRKDIQLILVFTLTQLFSSLNPMQLSNKESVHVCLSTSGIK